MGCIPGLESIRNFELLRLSRSQLKEYLLPKIREIQYFHFEYFHLELQKAQKSNVRIPYIQGRLTHQNTKDLWPFSL